MSTSPVSLLRTGLQFVPASQLVPSRAGEPVPRPLNLTQFPRASYYCNTNILRMHKRGRLAERYLFTLALLPYDDSSVWIGGSPHHLRHWIYNDGVTDVVIRHNSRKHADDRLIPMPVGWFDPMSSPCRDFDNPHGWKMKDVANYSGALDARLFDEARSSALTLHARYPKNRHRHHDQAFVRRIVQTLGPPLQLPVGRDRQTTGNSSWDTT